QARQNLWRAERRRNRNIAQILKRIHLVLRRFRYDPVAHAVFWIQPERWRCLKTPAERDKNVPSHVAGVVTGLLRLRPVDIDEKLRLIERLLNAQSGGAGNHLDLLQELLREVAIRLDVPAENLNIDRRREAEVQNLTDQVGGKKVEQRSRKFRGQLAPQFRDVFVEGMVFLGQRNQDVAVRRADSSVVAVRGIRAAIRDADIIEDIHQFARRHDLADSVLDQVEQLGGFLDACSRPGANVKAELAA